LILGVFGDGLFNGIILIYPWMTPVAMATKFWTKSAITRLISEIFARSLCITGGFRGRAIEWHQTSSSTINPRCHGNEIWDKIGL